MAMDEGQLSPELEELLGEHHVVQRVGRGAGQARVVDFFVY